ncbi:class I SAM-dependent methyltransferase [Flindersiella endophytica]
MSGVDPDEHSRQLAAKSLADDDPTGWFEQLYTDAASGVTEVPWDRGGPHPLLLEWVEAESPRGTGQRALIVGCGLGEDAELVAGLGFDTVAFDVSETGVEAAKARFPGSAVSYVVADLLALPQGWLGTFDFVVESLTVQALPLRYRAAAIAAVASTVAPGGRLLVIAAARPDDAPPDGGPPWPLSRAELESFGRDGLSSVRIESLAVPRDPAVRRWRAEFQRGR